MSTHKNFDIICCVVLVLTLILSVLFMSAGHLGVEKASAVMGYEKTLFDTSKVHTINIIMDDWDEFTENCKSEEYYACTVVIDNQAYKNVAIRGKGNTSLSQVNNDRYSYKIEFDHYDSTSTYYGLDKLCLNNIIQDNSYMKDYLAYQMMNEMGVASPLCSYAYITVNDEDWGLYLAVEGVEESFLQRNYGKDYGELYKPDSMNMGGGRGNGERFDMDEFFGDSGSENTDNNTGTQGGQNQNNFGNGDFPQMPNGNTDDNAGNQIPGGTQGVQRPNGNQGGFGGGQIPEGMTPPSDNGNNDFGGGMIPPDGFEPPDGVRSPDSMEVPGGMSGGMMNGSDDVLLKYIDDDIDSYSNIFENAKTDITNSDKTRLINALKKLNNGEDLDNTLEINAVIRYFVVHNFVLNFDSYTGSMIHNYYLYEKNGQMQMIPWDYNLAFGGFQSMDSATRLVNYPIDSPVSGGNAEDRPMIAWIFENKEYTELYHKYFSEFITEYFDSGYFESMIDNVNSMISPYVEKDPTKFCTYEEFETGISTLKEFCLLRAKSISGQLNGTIGSTSETQESDTLIDAGDIQINDMGSMNNTMGGVARPDGNMQKPQGDSEHSDNAYSSIETPSGDSNTTDNDGTGDKAMPQMPGNMQGEQIPDGNHGGTPPDLSNGENGNRGQVDPDGQMQRSDGKGRPSDNAQMQPQSAVPTSSWIMICVSALVLAMGLAFAFTYKRRQRG